MRAQAEVSSVRRPTHSVREHKPLRASPALFEYVEPGSSALARGISETHRKCDIIPIPVQLALPNRIRR
jgi:hypothetical protein